jgi:lipopolysaccharide-induced tumor necrosis factor-alpha factor
MEYREHVVYAPQEIYKIQSRGTQFAVCPQCRKAVQTVVQFKAGAGTYATGAFICLAGCSLGCCLAPCMLDDCNDAVHSCPVCAKEIGRKTFLFKC